MYDTIDVAKKGVDWTDYHSWEISVYLMTKREYLADCCRDCRFRRPKRGTGAGPCWVEPGRRDCNPPALWPSRTSQLSLSPSRRSYNPPTFIAFISWIYLTQTFVYFHFKCIWPEYQFHMCFFSFWKPKQLIKLWINNCKFQTIFP